MPQATSSVIESLYQPESDAFLKDPMPFQRRMSKECPIAFYAPWSSWIVNTHKLCAKLMKDPVLSTRFSEWEFAPQPKPEAEKNDFDHMFDSSLFVMSYEDHHRMRKLTLPAFSSRVLEKIERQLKDLIVDCFDQIGEPEFIEVFSQIATQLPIRAISRMVGVPADQEALFDGLAYGIVRAINPAISVEERKTAVERTLPGITMLKEMIAERRALENPGDDFLGTLVKTVDDEGDRLTDWELIGLVGALLGAGADTAVNLHTYILYEMLSHRDQYTLLMENPELMDAALHECLRHGQSGKTGIHRYALEDFEIEGQQVRKGQMVMLNISAANLDEEKYENPEKFDITRSFDNHILFGVGPHHCIGINLAKIQGSLMLQEFMKRFPKAELVSDPQIDKHHHNARRIIDLRIKTNLQ